MPNHGVRETLLGRGLYTPPEAARLVQIRIETVRRWVQGYTYPVRSRVQPRRASQPPLVRLRLPRVNGRTTITFLDLIELLIVRALKREGVSLQRIRRAADEARRILDTPYPFASRPIFTEGQNVFMQIGQAAGLAAIMQMGRGGQWILAAVMRDYLRQLEFDEESRLARRWWPLGRSEPVLVDPEISFGAPVLESVGLRTALIYEAVRVEGTPRSVASWYGITEDQVSAAIRFEESRLAA